MKTCEKVVVVGVSRQQPDTLNLQNVYQESSTAERPA
jgi:hypothetical protein